MKYEVEYAYFVWMSLNDMRIVKVYFGFYCIMRPWLLTSIKIYTTILKLVNSQDIINQDCHWMTKEKLLNITIGKNIGMKWHDVINNWGIFKQEHNFE